MWNHLGLTFANASLIVLRCLYMYKRSNGMYIPGKSYAVVIDCIGALLCIQIVQTCADFERLRYGYRCACGYIKIPLTSVQHGCVSAD